MTRAKVLSLGEMPDVERQLESAFELVRGDAGLAAHGPAIRAIVTRGRDRIGEEMLARLPAVELIANFGVGYDSIDVEAARRHGVVVTNTPDVLNDEVADLSVALLLATVRQIPQAERYLRSGRWLSGNFPLGPTLRDRTVGLIGMGRIGRRIAQRLRAFDVPVVYHSRTPQADVPYKHYPDLRAMAADVDTLLAIIPGGAGTRGIVDASVLAALGPRGIFINVARGSVVDERALIEALRSKTILAAGLDVFADEPRVPAALLDLDNVVLLPHVGSATVYTRGLMGKLVVDNVVSWFEGKGPVTPVPETPWRRKD
ncbi:MAG TPA: 2-hydroxyacid dehydrogenase [Myxococcales bacterium]|nr:2-hydroxyacid dehydrogenase [Myxococcales bacterium]